MAADCMDSLLINENDQDIVYALINPLDDSKAGHQSVDEELFKDIVWPKIVIAKRAPVATGGANSSISSSSDSH